MALSLISIEAISLILYFFRDAFAGALRYYLDILKIGPAWFIPDLLALVCVAVFVRRHIVVAQNPVAKLVFSYVLFSIVIGYFFLGSFLGVISSIKMLAPVFVGFCFCERDMVDYKKLLFVVLLLFYASIVGIVVSKYMDLPWIGYAYESFGAVREAARLWWSQDEVRLAGFAADSTMAAYFVLITFVLSSINRTTAWSLIWGGIGVYAIDLTTNKTCLGVLVIYLAALVFVRLFSPPADMRMLKKLSLLSFFCLAIPPALMLILSGTDLATMNAQLFSMQDRINNSWQLPFVYMSELMPTGFVTGCGLGCFNYPQQLFSPDLLAYFVPVDNFYIGTYLMFGLPFFLFVFYVVQAIKWTDDVYKLSVVFVMNIFTVTVLSYGPASGLLMIGFAFSQVFANRSQEEPAAELPAFAGFGYRVSNSKRAMAVGRSAPLS